MSALSPEPIASPPLVEYASALVMSTLWGITCLQTFLYFMHYHTQDRLFLKLMVVWLWFIDTVHTVLIDRGFWVLVYKNHDAFILSTEYLWAGLFTSLVALPTQLFFTYRIWRFAKNHWLIPLIFVPASLYQFGAYIAFTVICLQHGPTAQIINDIAKLPMSFWGVGAAQDILISGCLVWMIWRFRGHSTPKRTDKLLLRLTVVVINTGLWTALVALFIILTLVIWPQIQLYVSLYFIVCPLYCNTLLANFNSREYVRGSDFNTAIIGPFSNSGIMSGLPGGDPVQSDMTQNPNARAPPSHTDLAMQITTRSMMPKFANNSDLEL